MKIVLNGETVEVPSGGGVTVEEIEQNANVSLTAAASGVWHIRKHSDGFLDVSLKLSGISGTLTSQESSNYSRSLGIGKFTYPIPFVDLYNASFLVSSGNSGGSYYKWADIDFVSNVDTGVLKIFTTIPYSTISGADAYFHATGRWK